MQPSTFCEDNHEVNCRRGVYHKRCVGNSRNKRDVLDVATDSDRRTDGQTDGHVDHSPRWRIWPDQDPCGILDVAYRTASPTQTDAASLETCWEHTRLYLTDWLTNTPCTSIDQWSCASTDHWSNTSTDQWSCASTDHWTRRPYTMAAYTAAVTQCNCMCNWLQQQLHSVNMIWLYTPLDHGDTCTMETPL